MPKQETLKLKILLSLLFIWSGPMNYKTTLRPDDIRQNY